MSFNELLCHEITLSISCWANCTINIFGSCRWWRPSIKMGRLKVYSGGKSCLLSCVSVDAHNSDSYLNNVRQQFPVLTCDRDVSTLNGRLHLLSLFFAPTVIRRSYQQCMSQIMIIALLIRPYDLLLLYYLHFNSVCTVGLGYPHLVWHLWMIFFINLRIWFFNRWKESVRNEAVLLWNVEVNHEQPNASVWTSESRRRTFKWLDTPAF